jgi:hypothetical protein
MATPITLRLAVVCERAELMALQLRSSLNNPGDKDALLAKLSATGGSSVSLQFCHEPTGTPNSTACLWSLTHGETVSAVAWSPIAQNLQHRKDPKPCTSLAIRMQRNSMQLVVSILLGRS